ncbi:MAG: PGF-CTERM sorting domain-containing protein [Candidatus Thermoplasmatota archaeon]|nr:PGF-CTERM sorting domain-containing protein [Candidatus Thermoplasmatota archaeon]MED6338877.1 PGF-CTERM sorting domain-containing protein [Candidatus Thermoplasmatota archaeon]DAC61485.1 MAG TPA: PGF-CTERM sorting domain-containing protein [Candidatus Poseidoniales archaeon]HII49802.1 PGF-CTERM sorting domain-containing protein [Candidatus Poseidoniaceae archaeon]
MRRVVAITVICLILAMGIPSTNAKPAEPTNTGAVFGGQHTPIENLSTNSTPIDELPAIAEDFTATWCSNCLKAEEVLDDLETEGLVQKYEFHRSPDYEDPLGDDFASAYVTERYGENLPPLVAFNGTVKKHGTLPDSDSLESDYRAMIATPLNMGSGISTFSWTPKADCNCDIPDDYGIISWSLDLNMSNYPDSTLNVNAWFVEDSAEFADGGNGAGVYHDIVRNMTDLGSDLSGTATIKIPPAHDGNDLEVHLVYIMNLPEPITENQPPTTDSQKDDDSLPGFTVSFAVIAIAGAAIFTRRE